MKRFEIEPSSRLPISSNDQLYSLDGLGNLDEGSISNLFIHDNNSLSECEASGICNYLANPNGTVNIYNNASGCNNPPEVAIGCGISLPCLPYGNYYFYSQAEIDSFPSDYPDCTQLEGEVRISGEDIINLGGLADVNSIEGSLFIIDNTSLSDLEGLEGLTSIEENLQIGWWDSGENPFLESLAGLNGLSSIGGNLSIQYNPILPNLSGLNAVEFVGGYLSIYNNSSMTTLTGLENIDAGSISNLSIIYNHNLSECAVQSICDYLAGPNGTIDINDNAPGCNSQEEVEEACLTGIENPVIQNSKFKIQNYPNPTSGIVDFRFQIADCGKASLKVFDLQGREVAMVLDEELAAGEHTVRWNASTLLAGVYYYRLLTADRRLLTADRPKSKGWRDASGLRSADRGHPVHRAL